MKFNLKLKKLKGSFVGWKPECPGENHPTHVSWKTASENLTKKKSSKDGARHQPPSCNPLAIFCNQSSHQLSLPGSPGTPSLWGQSSQAISGSGPQQELSDTAAILLRSSATRCSLITILLRQPVFFLRPTSRPGSVTWQCKCRTVQCMPVRAADRAQTWSSPVSANPLAIFCYQVFFDYVPSSATSLHLGLAPPKPRCGSVWHEATQPQGKVNMRDIAAAWRTKR